MIKQEVPLSVCGWDPVQYKTVWESSSFPQSFQKNIAAEHWWVLQKDKHGHKSNLEWRRKSPDFSEVA